MSDVEQQSEHVLKQSLLSDGADFPVVPPNPREHMMSANAEEAPATKGRSGPATPSEEAPTMAGESSVVLTAFMWFLFLAHAGLMVYALKTDWSLTEFLVLQTPADSSCPTGGSWDSSLGVCRMRMFMSTCGTNVQVSA